MACRSVTYFNKENVPGTQVHPFISLLSVAHYRNRVEWLQHRPEASQRGKCLPCDPAQKSLPIPVQEECSCKGAEPLSVLFTAICLEKCTQ